MLPRPFTTTPAGAGTSRRSVLRAAAGLAALPLVAALPATDASAASTDAAQGTAFTPGEPWRDTAGNVIQAHGGQVVAAQDKDGARIWYWYGEDRSNGYYNSPGVHVYSSHDLRNWADEGLALRAMESADQFDSDTYFSTLYADYDADQRAAVYRDLGTHQVSTSVNPAIIERPKVIRNARTGKWVMWIHADGPSASSNAQYAKARAGVAVADSPTGPFRYIDSYRLHVAPEGEDNYYPSSPGMARDMNLFVDDDGTAYIIYSSEENYSLFVSRLDADYTYLATAPEQAVKGVDFTRPYIGAHREAPALFKFDGTYYLITSGATGWDPNPASYATATDILGEWTDHGNPATDTGASTTYTSQSTSVIPVDPKAGKYVYMGDRWTPSDLANSPYIWLPLRFGEGDSMTLPWLDSWTLEDDLTAQARYTVDAELPAHVWLGTTPDLPSTVAYVSGGRQRVSRVTWDTSGLVRPGLCTVTGTLVDFAGRTFTRDLLVVPKRLRYAVNAGGNTTDDWNRIVAVARRSGTVLNSVPEQALGADATTGATWGYTGEGSKARSVSGGDIYTTLRYAVSGRTLTYTLGGLDTSRRYTVHTGYYDPWPWANRAARVTVNGTVVDEQRLFTDEPVAGAYTGISPDADGVITLDVIPTRSPDIQLSWVMVAEER
ncbi:glycoside hydrolase family 43 protein [Streptomyces sp. VRA16 Mangrove soil]|uniref:glycoside hydrolase family 43 protein n=1 Tax=Streptomyces sp. VRA16 Mangrove soil TaxID=2817434 RepID=UPI001A9E3C38|nr:glycoside hydrolase family 43 protein [Streptomyces sp. VRA16 Mangrove soil]MBO1330775.1 family 43 glycosylhydrolase [Streptomyces sp. VRA16 Mangrove soil]